MTKRAQNFSVSQEYDEVWEILKEVDNKSQYICEAILHYSQINDKEKNLPDEDALRSMVQDILDDMLSDNIFLIKGTPETLPKTIDDFIKEDKERKETKVVEETKEEEPEEKLEGISGIVNDLADSDDAKNAALAMLGL